MCGIFGWIPSRKFQNVSLPQVATRLCTALAQRGPDDHGYTLFDEASHVIGDEHSCSGAGSLLLGQTRLAIIDPSPAGHQPMFSYDRRYCIVYNGEIYNYKELRTELAAEGVIFHTQTDTEVLLQAFITWGEACLSRLVGMFAFVIYDAGEKILFCARDCFGIKPLFYHVGPHGFSFASEIPALLEFPGIDRAVESGEVYTFLASGAVEQGPRTMVRDVWRLLPAHFMKIDVRAIQRAQEAQQRNRQVSPRRYWTLDLDAPATISFSDAVAQLREIFINNVRLHLRSDVPLGFALSGGMDSTAVVCAVRALEPDAELHTFSYIADELAISEESWVDMAVCACGSSSHKACPMAEDMLRDMDDLVLRMGEPFRTTSIYAQYSIMRKTRECGVKVLLEGQGADELFAGYTSYLSSRVMTLMARGEQEAALRFIEAAAQWAGREKQIQEILALLGLCPPVEAQPAVGILRHEVFSGVRLFRSGERRYASTDMLRIRLAEAVAYLSVPALMRHGDRNAMTFSVENRVPFLTCEMAEFAMSLPEEYLMGADGCTKRVLREALRGLVPDKILDRRDKIGFEAPGLPWMKKMLPWVMHNFITEESVFIQSEVLIKNWRNVLLGTVEFDWFYWRVLSYLRWKKLLSLREMI